MMRYLALAGGIVLSLCGFLIIGPSTSTPSPSFAACRTALVDGTGTVVFTGSNGALVSKVGC